MRIRAAGSQKDILIFGSIHPSQLPIVIKEHLTLNLHSTSYAQLLCEELTRLNQPADFHIEIDTGLSRTGIRFSDENASTFSYIESLYHEICFTLLAFIRTLPVLNHKMKRILHLHGGNSKFFSIFSAV